MFLKIVYKYFAVFLIATNILTGVFYFYQSQKWSHEISKLHNEIALNTKTIEIHRNAFEKKAAELENLDALLKTFQDEKLTDQETIAKLRKNLADRNSELLAVKRVAAKWKKAYEASVDAKVTVDEGKDPDSKEDDRIKVAFEKDFGYIGVSGYTLTNPGFAHVKIEQNRPLMLTMAISQELDGSWSSFVTSSEDNVDLDIKIAAVNPKIVKPKWYEKISVDAGMDVSSYGVFPYTGLSYPAGPVTVSAGVWSNFNNGTGYYSTVNYGWQPFAKKR